MSGRRAQSIGLALLLPVFVFAAYIPSMSGDFVSDDDLYISENPVLTEPDGLRRVWLSPGATPQYYPLVFTTFWIERRLWDLDTTGYHIANVLLHALNALLLWRILAGLQVPGAGFAAAVFALHPVHVESVAWITERKNVLSLALCLAAMIAYLRFTRLGRWQQAGARDRGHDAFFYATSLVLFVGALLSKTVTCTWPAVILLVIWWKTGRIRGTDVVRLAPMFVAGLAMGLVTAWVEKEFVGAEGATWHMGPMEHVLLAGRVVCFYAGKLVWPDPLMFIYPRWRIDPGQGWQYVYLAGCLVAVVGAWAVRRRAGRGPLAAMLFFVGTLAPVLGFINVYFMQFSFVADHFQYHASIGPIAAIAALSAWVGGKRRSLARPLWMLQAIILAVLAVNTWSEATKFIDGRTLWSDTLAKNPRAWIAYNNLGVLLERDGESAEAERLYRKALAVKPNLFRAHSNLGALLAERGEHEAGMAHLREAVRLAPNVFDNRFNLATAWARQERWNEAAEEYRRAIEIRPGVANARFGLAKALLELGDRVAAISELQECVRLQPDHAGAGQMLSELKAP